MDCKLWGQRRFYYLILAHIFVAGLSMSCGRMDSTGHGPMTLTVPSGDGKYVVSRSVDFFLDEEVKDGAVTGWIRSDHDRCEVWVDLCNHGACENGYHDVLNSDVEVSFKITSDENGVFYDYLEWFEPCYKGSEWFQEPFNFQNFDCNHSKDDLEIVFQATCPATLQAVIDVNYYDNRNWIDPEVAFDALWSCW